MTPEHEALAMRVGALERMVRVLAEARHDNAVNAFWKHGARTPHSSLFRDCTEPLCAEARQLGEPTGKGGQ